MSTFSIKASFSCLPIEETAFTDTTQKVKTVHSLIDRGVSGTMEKTYSTDATNIQYVTTPVLVGAAELYLSDLVVGTVLARATFLAIVISAPLAGDTDALAAASLVVGSETFSLQGVGDFAVLPLSSLGTFLATISVAANGAHGSTLEMIVGLA